MTITTDTTEGQTMTTYTREPDAFDAMSTLEWSASSTHRMTWDEAHAWCRDLREGGHEDWRLPTIEELDYSRLNPACALPDTVAPNYWSATTGATNPNFAWLMFFGNGGVGLDDKGFGYYVRGVRSGSDHSIIRPVDPSTTDRMLDAVRSEIDRAHATYGDYTSTHEALGVLSEEWDELREAIHADRPVTIRNEALQVAAVAIRLAAQCQVAHEAGEGAPTHFARRSFKWARK